MYNKHCVVSEKKQVLPVLFSTRGTHSINLEGTRSFLK